MAKFPDSINHHGLRYARSFEKLPNGDILLCYTCVNYPELGTLRAKVDVTNGNERFIESVMANIYIQINQWMSEFVQHMITVMRAKGQREKINIDNLVLGHNQQPVQEMGFDTDSTSEYKG